MKASYELRDYRNQLITKGSKEHCVKTAKIYGTNDIIGYDTTGKAIMLYAISQINYETVSS